MEYSTTTQFTSPQLPLWLQRLILVSLFALGIAYLFQVLTPDTAPSQSFVITNYDDSSSSFSNIGFTGTAISIPERLPLATATRVERTNTAVEQNIVRYHDLSPHPEISGIWLGDAYNLTKTTFPELYVLTLANSSETVLLPNGIELQQALQVTRDYVRSVFVAEGLEPVLDSAVYYQIGEHPHPEEVFSPNEANTLEIAFGYTYGSYPIFLEKDYQYPIRILLNSDYEIQKVTFQPFELEFEEERMYETLTIQQAIGNLQAGVGSIIYSKFDGHGNPLLYEIVRGSLTDVSIEYRVDTQSKSLLPYYRFSGELENSDGEAFSATVLTPAIQTER